MTQNESFVELFNSIKRLYLYQDHLNNERFLNNEISSLEFAGRYLKLKESINHCSKVLILLRMEFI